MPDDTDRQTQLDRHDYFTFDTKTQKHTYRNIQTGRQTKTKTTGIGTDTGT